MGFQSTSPFDSARTKLRPTPNTDVFEKSEALDRERLEVACLRQDIIDEYEKKSAQLLKYLDSMESAFDHQRAEYEDRETNLRRENEELRHELAHGCRAHVAELLVKEQELEEKAQQVVHAVQLLKSELKEKERIAQKEHKKAKVLQDMVEELQLTLEKKEEEHESVRRREERSRKHFVDENDELRRKAALGWMLGCLSELYLRLDPGIGTGGIMKLVRKVQRELESGNHVFTTGAGGMMPPKLEYELIQREIRRLISATSSSSSSSGEPPLGNRPDLSTEKLRTSASILRTSCRPREFTGELPGDRRRKMRESKSLRDREAAMRSISAPSQLLSRREAASLQPFILQDHPKQKHHISCHQDMQKRNSGTWAEVRLLEADQTAKAAKQTSYQEIKKILQRLESSMTYLLGQERRRHLYNQRRI